METYSHIDGRKIDKDKHVPALQMWARCTECDGTGKVDRYICTAPDCNTFQNRQQKWWEPAEVMAHLAAIAEGLTESAKPKLPCRHSIRFLNHITECPRCKGIGTVAWTVDGFPVMYDAARKFSCEFVSPSIEQLRQFNEVANKRLNALENTLQALQIENRDLEEDYARLGSWAADLRKQEESEIPDLHQKFEDTRTALGSAGGVAVKLIEDQYGMLDPSAGYLHSHFEGYALLKNELDSLWALVGYGGSKVAIQSRLVLLGARVVKHLVDLCGVEKRDEDGCNSEVARPNS